MSLSKARMLEFKRDVPEYPTDKGQTKMVGIVNLVGFTITRRQNSGHILRVFPGKFN